MGFLDLNNSRATFSYFDKKDRRKINVFKFLIGVIWLSFANLKQKILFLTKMFSLRDELQLYLHEVIFLFQYTCRSISKILRVKMPSKEVLRIAAKKAFMSADIDNNGYLSIDEIELWCTTNYEWKNFLFRFESPKLIPYEKDTFEDFSKIDFRFFISEVLNT